MEMTADTKSNLRKFLLKKFPTNMYIDCPISKETQEVMIEYAESLAKDRAVGFAEYIDKKYQLMIDGSIEENYDTFFAEKRKEGASTSEFCQCDFHKNHNRVEFDFTVNCTLCNKPISNYQRKEGAEKSFCECGSQKDIDCKYCTSCNKFHSV